MQQQPVQRLSDIECVIFDKDGTLVCFHDLWANWAARVADGTSLGLRRDLRRPILQRMGVDPDTLRVGPGLLAEATRKDIADALTLLAIDSGAEPEVAGSTVCQAMLDCDVPAEDVRFIPGVEDTVLKLRRAGLKVGVCTADNRVATEATLAGGRLLALLDAGVACGDDPDIRPKPHPSGAHRLCALAGVPPGRTIVVGDTATDMRLGINAGLAGCVGVLTGIGTPEILLAAGATHIVQSVADVPQLLGLLDSGSRCFCSIQRT